jgi:tyrosyl-tRNA synthetase
VLDVERATVRRNSEWLAELDAADLIRLASVTTIARMLEREDFRARYEGNQPISVVEFLYPLLQGLRLGRGRGRYRARRDRPDVQPADGPRGPARLRSGTAGRWLTLPLIEGLDGVRKMSKSFDNYVG